MNPEAEKPILVRSALENTSRPGTTVWIDADRWQLAKRRWRGTAADHTAFGFDVKEPLADGDAVHAAGEKCYRIRQKPETVLVIPVTGVEAAATLAWNIGNLHQPAQVTPEAVITADDTGVRHLLKASGMAYREETRIFTPIKASGTHRHHHHHGA